MLILSKPFWCQPALPDFAAFHIPLDSFCLVRPPGSQNSPALTPSLALLLPLPLSAQIPSVLKHWGHDHFPDTKDVFFYGRLNATIVWFLNPPHTTSSLKTCLIPCYLYPPVMGLRSWSIVNSTGAQISRSYSNTSSPRTSSSQGERLHCVSGSRTKKNL